MYGFNLPTQVKYGVGVLEDLAPTLRSSGSTKVLLITDKGIVTTGLAEQISARLEEGGMDVVVFDDVAPNPRDKNVHEAFALLNEQKCDAVVGLGGGSAMDCGKCVAALTCNPGRINDYEGIDLLTTKPSIPLVAIPTTAGTGAEVSGWAVITDTSRNYKMGIGSHFLAPQFAFVDPTVTVGLPQRMTAYSGLDALCQAIEAYICRCTSPIVEALAVKAMVLINENIRQAYAKGDDIAARSGMSFGSMIAGIAMANSDCAGVHSAAETLGGYYDLPHGLTVAVMMPPVFRYSMIACMDKFADIAGFLGERVEGLSLRDRAIKAIEAIEKLLGDLDIPSIAEIGVKREDIPELARIASQNISVNDNPRKLSQEDFVKIYNSAFDR